MLLPEPGDAEIKGLYDLSWDVCGPCEASALSKAENKSDHIEKMKFVSCYLSDDTANSDFLHSVREREII